MSVVGPRSERPEFLDKLCKEVPHWNSRHLLKPGLTGWAQIRFSYASDVNESKEKLAFDLYYQRMPRWFWISKSSIHLKINIEGKQMKKVLVTEGLVILVVIPYWLY